MRNFEGLEVLGFMICLFMMGCLGYGLGFLIGEKQTREKITIECVTTPQDCKVRYQYYQLEANQK